MTSHCPPDSIGRITANPSGVSLFVFVCSPMFFGLLKSEIWLSYHLNCGDSACPGISVAVHPRFVRLGWTRSSEILKSGLNAEGQYPRWFKCGERHQDGFVLRFGVGSTCLFGSTVQRNPYCEKLPLLIHGLNRDWANFTAHLYRKGPTIIVNARVKLLQLFHCNSTHLAWHFQQCVLLSGTLTMLQKFSKPPILRTRSVHMVRYRLRSASSGYADVRSILYIVEARNSWWFGTIWVPWDISKSTQRAPEQKALPNIILKHLESTV